MGARRLPEKERLGQTIADVQRLARRHRHDRTSEVFDILAYTLAKLIDIERKRKAPDAEV